MQEHNANIQVWNHETKQFITIEGNFSSDIVAKSLNQLAKHPDIKNSIISEITFNAPETLRTIRKNKDGEDLLEDVIPAGTSLDRIFNKIYTSEEKTFKFNLSTENDSSTHTFVLHREGDDYYLINSSKDGSNETKESEWYKRLEKKINNNGSGKLHYRPNINAQNTNQGCIFSAIYTEMLLKNKVKVGNLPKGNIDRTIEQNLIDLVYNYSSRYYQDKTKPTLDNFNDEGNIFLTREEYNQDNLPETAKPAIVQGLERLNIALDSALSGAGIYRARPNFEQAGENPFTGSDHSFDYERTLASPASSSASEISEGLVLPQRHQLKWTLDILDTDTRLAQSYKPGATVSTNYDSDSDTESLDSNSAAAAANSSYYKYYDEESIDSTHSGRDSNSETSSPFNDAEWEPTEVKQRNFAQKNALLSAIENIRDANKFFENDRANDPLKHLADALQIEMWGNIDRSSNNDDREDEISPRILYRGLEDFVKEYKESSSEDLLGISILDKAIAHFSMTLGGNNRGTNGINNRIPQEAGELYVYSRVTSLISGINDNVRKELGESNQYQADLTEMLNERRLTSIANYIFEECYAKDNLINFDLEKNDFNAIDNTIKNKYLDLSDLFDYYGYQFNDEDRESTENNLVEKINDLIFAEKELQTAINIGRDSIFIDSTGGLERVSFGNETRNYEGNVFAPVSHGRGSSNDDVQLDARDVPASSPAVINAAGQQPAAGGALPTAEFTKETNDILDLKTSAIKGDERSIWANQSTLDSSLNNEDYNKLVSNIINEQQKTITNIYQNAESTNSVYKLVGDPQISADSKTTTYKWYPPESVEVGADGLNKVKEGEKYQKSYITYEVNNENGSMNVINHGQTPGDVLVFKAPIADELIGANVLAINSLGESTMKGDKRNLMEYRNDEIEKAKGLAAEIGSRVR